ncbi:NADPH-dependent F420 reductase [Pseudoclavibacter soli]|uniref:NADPH-dependent F420 reductase n=1 Tax=Pseudoclavibacter soli TaxID=452623 RepID=UPI00040C9AA4|nr:NAD(P)-binding domain-containing protein [Pseudoclavibacter soli]
MSTITVIGQGNIGKAVEAIAQRGGNTVQFVGHEADATIEGDIVVLAVPYPALAEIAGHLGAQLAGKTVVDVTNPLDFNTFDSLVVPADASAAAELQAQLPAAKVLKAFNTNFAATLATGKVGSSDQTTTVLIAGDDEAAKAALGEFVTAGGLNAVDAGSLKRARELEAIGFVQLTLGAGEKIGWDAGFALVK